MGRQRREFTPEFKDEAVRLVINTGRAVCQRRPKTEPLEPKRHQRVRIHPAATGGGDSGLVVAGS